MQLDLHAVKCMHACSCLVVPGFMFVVLQITLVTMTYHDMHITLAKLCTCSQIRVSAMTTSLPVSSCVSLKPLILRP